MDEQKRVPLRVLEMALNSAWAILPDALPPILRIAAREGDEVLEAVRAELGQELDNTRRVDVRDGVAVIPITGPIFRKANLFTEISGATSIDVLAADFKAALESPEVRAIMFDINSPGGQVDGVSEMAQLIYTNRGTKPIYAHIDGFGASAGYWLASAADRVTASDTSLVGSIGVISTHQLPDGKERTIEIVSSQSPYKSVDIVEPAGRKRVQRLVDDMAGVFVESSAKHRGVSTAEVLANFGKGDVLIASRALRAGMIDAVTTFEDAIGRLTGKASNAFGRAAQQKPLDMAATGTGAFTAYLTQQLTQGTSGSWSDATGGWHTKIETLTTTLAGSNAKVDDGQAVKTQTKPTPAAQVVEEEVVDMTPEEIAAGQAEAVKKERERVAAINAAAGEVAHLVKASHTLAEVAIEAGHSVEDFRKTIQGNLPKADDLKQPPAESRVQVGNDREAMEPFRSMGEQLKVGILSGGMDKRLLHINAGFAAATGHSETVPADGGFLLQDNFVQGIEKLMHDSGQIYSRCNSRPVGPNSNALVYSVIDESSRADGSRRGGIRGYWVGEGEAPTRSKLGLRQDRLPLEKVGAVTYLTEEQQQDTVQLEGEVMESVPEELLFKIEDAIVEGDGAGKPLGWENAGCTIDVAKETGQSAATIKAENINKMWARFWAKSMTSPVAAWFINQDCIPQLDAMYIAAGTGGVPAYMPPGGLSGSRFGTLKGVPVIPIEFCETLGTVGDIVLADLSQYRLAEKGGPQMARSMHVKFLEGEECLRFIYRINGQPMWKKALTPFKGSNTVSPFIRLATRS